jgi:hypothetical protein
MLDDQDVVRFLAGVNGHQELRMLTLGVQRVLCGPRRYAGWFGLVVTWFWGL